MKRTLKLTLIASVTLFLFGCSSNENPYKDMSESEIYTIANQELNDGSIRAAVKPLEELNRNYPFGPNTQQVQLNLIYAYYKTSEYPLAISAIDRYLRLYPVSPYTDWVVYMRGISNMALEKNMLQNWFNVERYNRDTSFNNTAFTDLTYLVTRFPNSPYSYDAQLRLIYLKNQMARHELGIARYYADRGAPVAVVNRVNNMLINFPDTDATKEALLLMRDAYANMGITENVERTETLINSNKTNVTEKSQTRLFLGWF